MIQLSDLMDGNLLMEMVRDGYISCKTHPSEDLQIYNYTAKAAYNIVWNDATTQCRGLIARSDGTVAARPFRKFWNLDDHPPSDIPDEPFTVTEKFDGSLGILYPTRDGHAVASRGSFISSQAERATQIWQERYVGRVTIHPASTYLFEIVYPANRIVVDYAGLDDLVLLAVLDTETGRDVTQESGAWREWTGPKVEPVAGSGTARSVAAIQRNNAEGYVLSFQSGFRVKVKHEEYVRLHRLITGITTKTIWEYLSEGRDMAEITERVPDEFYSWFKATVQELQDSYHQIEADARAFFDTLPPGSSRKDAAAHFSPHPHRAILFLMLDGRDYSKVLWKTLRPEYARPFKVDIDG
ncbi:MAG: 2'-5' RNA ligase [Armatimonadota bacterium]|nr:2'-5' RNA ligase [Armatimonadota bacterium]